MDNENLGRRMAGLDADIEQLVWLAGVAAHDILDDFPDLDDPGMMQELFGLSEERARQLLPDHESGSDYDVYGIWEALEAKGIRGFVAEVQVPVRLSVNDDGSYVSDYDNHRRLLAYGDDLESLVENIEAGARALAKQDLAAA